MDYLKRRQPPRIFHELDDEFMPFSPRVEAIALAQAVGQQMPQVTLARKVLGRIKDGVMQLPELDLQIALVGHLERVLHRLGNFGKARLHLLGRA